MEEQAGYLSCDTFGQLASTHEGQELVLTFSNQTGQYRRLDWIDGNGTPVDQGGLDAGQDLSFTTDPGHVWMATDGPGNCREMIRPVPEQTRYILTVE